MRLPSDIEAEAKDQLKGYVVPAIQHLKELVEGAQSESVQLGAIKDVLDRAGLKPVDKQQVEQVNRIDNMSDEELQTKLDAICMDQYGVTLEELDAVMKSVKAQRH
jgi:hypothetical protein